MKNFLSEFKTFVTRGNVMDLAIGVLIGAAFQAVVTALTDNILSPVIGLFTGGINLDGLEFTALGATIKYGAFLTAIINFLIMAFVIFMLVKGMNALAGLGRKKATEAPKTKNCPFCCTEIPVAAVRCPNCTAELSAEAVKAAK